MMEQEEEIWGECLSESGDRICLYHGEGEWQVGDNYEQNGFFVYCVRKNIWAYENRAGKTNVLKGGFQEALAMAEIFFVDC